MTTVRPKKAVESSQQRHRQFIPAWPPINMSSLRSTHDPHRYHNIGNQDTYSKWSYGFGGAISLFSIVVVLLVVVKYVLCLKMWSDVAQCVDKGCPGLIDLDFFKTGGTILILSELWITVTIFLAVLGLYDYIMSKWLKLSMKHPLIRSSCCLLGSCLLAILDYFFNWLHFLLIYKLMLMSTRGLEEDLNTFAMFQQCLSNTTEVRFLSFCFEYDNGTLSDAPPEFIYFG